MNISPLRKLVFVIALLASTASSTFAWHRHGGCYDRYYLHSHHFYHRDWSFACCLFFCVGWAGPNVIINIPAPRYYVPVCHDVEVCNSFGDCWLEPHCD